MSGSLYHGRRFRKLSVLDEGVWEGLAIEIDMRLPARCVVRVLQQLEVGGLPKAIRLDNGPGLTLQYLAAVPKTRASNYVSSSRASRIKTPLLGA
jgi:putative transposase